MIPYEVEHHSVHFFGEVRWLFSWNYRRKFWLLKGPMFWQYLFFHKQRFPFETKNLKSSVILSACRRSVSGPINCHHYTRSAYLKRRQVHLLFEDVKFRPYYVSLSQAITFYILIRLSLALHIFQIGRAIRKSRLLKKCALPRRG